MNKRTVILALIMVLLSACAVAPVDSSAGIVDQSARNEKNQGVSSAGEPAEADHQATIEALSASGFTAQEIEGILFMREEEKLARDVYLELADKWGMNVFSNIAGSEDTHMEAMLTLIEIASLDDPVEGKGQGEFTNQELQALYNDLVVQGEASLAEALLVGGAIEEIDILDLQEYLDRTENPALIEVYQNLLKGSINHLNAFVRTYQRQTGEVYQPQYLSEEAFQELLAAGAPFEGGRGQGLADQPQGDGRGRVR